MNNQEKLKKHKEVILHIGKFIKEENVPNRLRGLIGAFSERGDTASKLSLVVNAIDQPRIDDKNNMYIGVLEQMTELIDLDDDDVDFTLLSLFKGFMFHELSHYDYTEFKPYKDFIEAENGKFKQLRNHILNLMEDGRIERRKEKEKRITGKYFDLINFFILDMQKDTDVDGLTNIDFYFRSIWPIIKLNMYPKDYDTYPDEVKKAVDESLKHIEIGVIAENVKALTIPCEEMVRIAKSLMTPEQLQQSEQQQSAPMEVQSGDSGEASPSDEGSGGEQPNEKPGEESGKKSGESSNSKQKNEKTNEEMNEKAKASEETNEKTNEKNKPSSYDEGKKEKIKDFLKKKEQAEKRKERKEIDGQKEGTSLSNKEITEIEKIYSGEKFRVENADFQRFLSLSPEVKMRGKKLRKEIEKILKTKQKEVLNGQKKGIINPNDLYKLASCNTDVFRKTLSPQRMENVVYILRDGSGSMTCGNKIRNSTDTAAILEEALKGLIPFKDVIFNTAGRDIMHYVISDFDKKNKKDNHAYSSSSLFGGTNKDGFSLRIAIAELLQRKEPSKILFVLSDGLPSDYNSEEAAISDVRDGVKEAKKKGVKVVSIFFGTEYEREKLKEKYHQMYGDSVICVDPTQIEKSTISLLKRILKGT